MVSSLGYNTVIMSDSIAEVVSTCATCENIIEIGHKGFVEPDTGLIIHYNCRVQAIKEYRMANPGVTVVQLAELFNCSERTVKRAAYKRRNNAAATS